jgi:uncharacterized membrane protein YjgN (DUF898 family)
MATDGDADYIAYTREQLEEAFGRIQRDRFPINYQRLIAEIERRRIEAESAAAAAPGVNDANVVVRYRPEFRADPKEYFRIWIINLALTILTLGIYSAWAKVRKLRYFYASTVLAGSTFGYHGDPRKILKGRIIAAILAGSYLAAGRISPIAALIVAGILAVATPWLVVKSRMFAMRVTSWRGLRFDFRADYMGAYRALLGWLVLGIVSLGLLMPRLSRERYRFIVTRSSFGNSAFECNPSIGRFYKTAIEAVGLMLAIAIPASFLFGLISFGLAAAHGKPQPPSNVFGTLFVIMLYAVMLPTVLGYTHARNLNEVFGRTSLGHHQLHSSLSASRLIGIYFTNLIGMVLTLGLYTPWAQVRLARYRLESLEVEAHGSLDDIVAATGVPVPAATGEEISSFFDLDFGF